MHRSKTATSLLAQLCVERSIDIVIVSEQYQQNNRANWFSDELGTAAIWVKNPRLFRTITSGRSRGFVLIKDKQLTVVSCYFTPNDTVLVFETKLANLEDTLVGLEGKVLIAGDFNAKAPAWGEDYVNPRGRRIIEKKCFYLRRRALRIRKTDVILFQNRSKEYLNAKKLLSKTIKGHKCVCWKNLTMEEDSNQKKNYVRLFVL